MTMNTEQPCTFFNNTTIHCMLPTVGRHTKSEQTISHYLSRKASNPPWQYFRCLGISFKNLHALRAHHPVWHWTLAGQWLPSVSMNSSSALSGVIMNCSFRTKMRHSTSFRMKKQTTSPANASI